MSAFAMFAAVANTTKDTVTASLGVIITASPVCFCRFILCLHLAPLLQGEIPSGETKYLPLPKKKEPIVARSETNAKGDLMNDMIVDNAEKNSTQICAKKIEVRAGSTRAAVAVKDRVFRVDI